MNLEIQSRLSFYRRLEEVEHKKGISLVRHVETGQIYVEKVLTQYDKRTDDFVFLNSYHFPIVYLEIALSTSIINIIWY